MFTVRAARLLDIGADPADEADLRVRKRAAVAATLAFIGFAVLYGAVNAVVARPALVALALVQITAFGIALLSFRRTRRLAPLVTLITVIGLGSVLGGLLLAGGLTTTYSLTWSLLVPLGAVLFLGARAARPAYAAVVVTVLLGIAIDFSVVDASPSPEPIRLTFAALNLLVPAAVALGLVLFIDGERVRARAESDALLRNILPGPIADRLKRGERAIADLYDDVTVLFADVVEFTPFAAQATPTRVVAVLNELFSRFDVLAERYGLEKIKTIGDAYMVVAGAPIARPDHAEVILEMALAMLAEAGVTELSPGQPVRLRCGIASGPVVAGVIGHRKFSFDLWGDAVNLASRMETTGIPGTIQVAESTHRLCRVTYPFSPRDVEVKGKGLMRTYLLDPRSSLGHPRVAATEA